MTVYVDDVKNPFGNMVMCHMWSDTEAELLAMADRIGVQRKWIQGHQTLSTGKARNAAWVHFDIAVSKKKLALKAGAVLTDMFGPTEHLAQLDLKSGDQFRVKRGETMLDRIANSRRLRAEPELQLQPRKDAK